MYGLIWKCQLYFRVFSYEEDFDFEPLSSLPSKQKKSLIWKYEYMARF